MNGITVMLSMVKLWPERKCSRRSRFAGLPSASRVDLRQLWYVASLMYTDTFSFRASTSSPATWSACSWEITMALIWCGSSPETLMRLLVSRQERPASTRMLEPSLEMTVQLPRLPLANTVMRTDIGCRIAGLRVQR